MALNLQSLWHRKLPRPLEGGFHIGGVLDTERATQVAGPYEILAAFGLQAGDRALEVGGWGLYSAEVARRLGSSGHLICMDIGAGPLIRTREQVREAGVEADFLHASAADLPLRAASLDHILLMGVLGEMRERTDMLLELRRVLRPDGRLSISEPLFPPDSQAVREMKGDLLVAGFVRDRSRDWLAHTSSWLRVG